MADNKCWSTIGCQDLEKLESLDSRSDLEEQPRISKQRVAAADCLNIQTPESEDSRSSWEDDSQPDDTNEDHLSWVTDQSPPSALEDSIIDGKVLVHKDKQKNVPEKSTERAVTQSELIDREDSIPAGKSSVHNDTRKYFPENCTQRAVSPCESIEKIDSITDGKISVMSEISEVLPENCTQRAVPQCNLVKHSNQKLHQDQTIDPNCEVIELHDIIKIPDANLRNICALDALKGITKNCIESMSNMEKDIHSVIKSFKVSLDETNFQKSSVPDTKISDYETTYYLESTNLLCENLVRCLQKIKKDLSNLGEMTQCNKDTSRNLSSVATDNCRAVAKQPFGNASIKKAKRTFTKDQVNNGREVTNDQLLKFMKENIQKLESKGIIKEQKKARKILDHNKVSKNICNCANNKHNNQIWQCREFLQLPPEQRFRLIKTSLKCVNCLRAGHKPNECTSRHCNICNKKHNDLLHYKGPVSLIVSKLSSDKGNSVQLSMVATVIVYVYKDNGEKIKARAILDSGSQVNIMSAEFFQKIDVKAENEPMVIEGIGGIAITTNKKLTINMESCHDNFKTKLEVCVVEDAIIRQPEQDIDISNWDISRHLLLADENFYCSSNVDLIIGSELFLKILSPGFTELGLNLPQLQNTVFGWIVMGKVNTIRNEVPFSGMVYGNKSIQFIPADENLNDSSNENINMWYYEPTHFHHEEIRLQTFIKWPLSFINPQKLAKSGFYFKGPDSTNVKCYFCKVEIKNWEKNDDEVYEHLRWSSLCPLLLRQKTNNIPINEKELDEILPTKSDNSQLYAIVIEKPDFIEENHYKVVSQQKALDHFLKLEYQFLKNPELKEQYVKFMDDYIKRYIIEEIDIEKDEKQLRFVQHYPDIAAVPFHVKFGIFNDDVYNNRQATQKFVGSFPQIDLLDVLLRFRRHQCAFSTSVVMNCNKAPGSKAIQWHNDKRLIVWRSHPYEKMRYYTHNMPIQNGLHRILAVQTLQRCIFESDEISFKDFAMARAVSQKDFNLGNLLTGTNNHLRATQLQRELIEMLKSFGLILHNWCSNEKVLREQVPTAHQQSNLTIIDIRTTKCNALIFIWNSISDTFEVKYRIEGNQDINEDVIRLEAENLFDPLGLLGPVLMYAKHTIKKLNSLSEGWVADKQKLVQNWQKFRDQLKQLDNHKVSVPRRIIENAFSKTQLHIFISASSNSYGVVVYTRTSSSLDRTWVHLMYSKSNEPQYNSSTIQQMEAKAAVVALECNNKITSIMEIPNMEVWYWASSKLEMLNMSCIDITLNPASLLCEVLSVHELLDSDLWWHGPLFLRESQTKWPISHNKHGAQPKAEKIAESTNINKDFASKSIVALNPKGLHDHRPFNIVKISFIGPVKIRYNDGKIKSNGFVCLLTCMKTKAIRLEPIIGKYIAAITDCLYQSFSNHGQPSTLWFDDNTVNNMGDSKLGKYLHQFMRRYNQTMIAKFCQTMNVNWKIISENNTRNLWQMAIESGKEQLFNVLKINIIEQREFSEILSSIESIINSRPVKPKSNNQNDLAVETARSQIICTSTNRNVHHQLTRNKFRSWLKIRTIASEFWRNWMVAYHNNFKCTRNSELQIGQLITVKEKHPPPSQWKTGRVINFLPDSSMLKNEVLVKTKLGLEVKHAHELCMIPNEGAITFNGERLEHQPIGKIKSNSERSKNKHIVMRIKKEREPDIYSSLRVRSDRVKRSKARNGYASSYAAPIALVLCLFLIITGAFGIRHEVNSPIEAFKFGNFSTNERDWKNGGWVSPHIHHMEENTVSNWMNYIAWTIFFLLVVAIKPHSTSARAIPPETPKCVICSKSKASYRRILDCYCVMCESCVSFAVLTMQRCPVCFDDEVTGIDSTPVDINGHKII